MNTQRVLYTRQIQIDQDDGIEQLSSYATNVHPRAYQDVASTLVDTAVNISPLENDWDANGDAISIKEFDATSAKGGTVTESNGVLTYTPPAGYVGKDVFAYAVQDAAGLYTKNAVHVEVINQDLAAHWKFEETSGTTGADDTGLGHDASVVGADFSSDSITGPVGKAIALGASDYIIGDDSNLITGGDTEYPLDAAASNFFDPMDQSFTVATWFKLEPGTTSARIVSKRNNSALGYLFSASTTGGLSSQVRFWDGLESAISVSGGNVAEDTWHHAAMVINRSDNTLRLYLDGVEVGTAASISAGFNIFNGRADFTIGGSGALAVDDMQVYTKPLTAAELLAMRNAGDVPSGSPTPGNLVINLPTSTDLSWSAGNASYQQDVYFGTDPAAVAAATTASPEYQGRQSANSFDPGALEYGKTYYWRVDQVDGSTIIGGSTWSFSTAASAINENLVLHLSMDDSDLQVSEGVAHTYDDVALPAHDFTAYDVGASQTGVIGQAVDLTAATDTLRSKVVSPVQKPASGGVTVSFWINTASAEDNRKVYDGGGAYFMRYYNGDLQTVFDGSSSGAVIFDTNINDGQWHHIVAQNDGAGTTTVYVDGTAVGTQSESLYDVASLGRYFGIGSNYGSSGSENLSASVDDFAVWERALTTGEITSIHTAGLAGKSFNDIDVVADSSFEVAEGFSGFNTEALTNLGSVTDVNGVTWTEVSDVKIWNRADLAPAGVQLMALGIDTSSSQLDISLPSEQLGVGTVSFDYASYSGSANNTFRLLYNDNSGSGWVEAWSTQVIGSSPSSDDRPWQPVEVSINVPGHVDLRFETNGSRGAMFDNFKVSAAVVNTNTAPSFTASPIAGANAVDGSPYSGTVAGSATDVDAVDELDYRKVSGPAWLSVAADGTLSGTPSFSDVGANVFTIEVADGSGGTDTATLNITVEQTPVFLSSDFEGAAGTTIGGGWIEQINDSRIFDTNNVATQMVISQNAGEPFAIANQLTQTFVAGERYALTWNGARATTSSGTLNFKAEIGTWDGSTFTPLATEEGALENVNLLSKVAGTPVYYTALAADAGEQIAVRLEVLAGSSDWVGFDDIQLENIGTNVAPAFTANPLSKANATEDVAYSGSIGSDASDSDAGDSISYSKVAGPAWLAVAADGTLSGTPSNADVGVNAFTVRVTDAGGFTNDATLNIAVDNVNDAPVANDNSGSVAESAANGSPVLTVAATDPDAGDSLTYAITAGNTGGAFAIDNNGNITTAAGLDFETTNSYVLTVTVTDSSSVSDTATVTVNVTDDNEAPTANDNSGSVAENTSAGAVIATVTSSDPDAGDSVSFAITAGNTGNAFAINSSTGVITTTTALDYETATSYTLTVTATDNGGLTDTATVNVTVTNVNEAPTANDATLTVAENASAGTSAGSVTSSDEDAADSTSYAITAGNAGGEFAIDSNTGEVTTTEALDYEATASYAFTVTATDGGGLTDTAAITVNVTNVNEAPVANDTSGTVAEDVSIGTAVATVSSTDPDAGDSVIYAITAGNTGNAFTIDSNTGAITTAAALDFETTPSYTLTVTATDGGGLSDTATVTVTVTDVQEAIFRSNWAALADQNPVADPSTYFDGTVATAAGTIDFENVSGNLRLWNGGVGDKDFIGSGGSDVFENVIEITDAQYANDTEYTLSYVVGTGSSSNRTGDWFIEFGTRDGGVFTPLGVVDSGSASNVTGSLALTDTENLMDNTNNSALFGGNVGGRILTVTFNPGDAATGKNIAFRFGTTSSNQFAGISDMLLDSTAVADPNVAPVANDNSGTLAENATIGAAVATVAATDPNAGDTLSYAITAGNTGNAFAIDNSGNITTAAGLDFETTASYSLTVTVSDDATPALSDTATVSVTVTDVNEAPVANDNSGTIAEDVAIGTAVATVSASDVDAGDSLTYAITGGNTGNAFAIDNSGNITTAAALDYETTASYTLTVTVTDSGSLTDTATVNVTVTDVVETTAPVVATGSATNLAMTTADLGYSITDDGGEAPSVTLYYGETDGGTTPASWANSVAVGAKATGAYTESISGLTEGTNYFFTLAATNSVGTTWGSTGSFTTVADTSPKMVRTTVNSVSSTTWTTVDLGKNYNSAVIVATPIYADSTQVPVVTRIRNVAGSSFELKLDRADGLTTETTCNVSVVAVEEGVYTLANDGVQMEAVKFNSTVTANKSLWAAEARTFQNSYTAPVVVGQVMSANDANWSVFWSMGSSRLNPVDASNFNVGKHVGEDSNTTRANETVGYIVIESGNGTINGVAYTAALGADTVRNYENSASGYSYSLTGLSSASAAALSSSAMDGGDGAWPVLNGADALSASTLKLVVVEDEMTDTEQKHVTEQISYIIFE